MGALPKQRQSNGRQGRRRQHHKIAIPQLTECPNCHQMHQVHHVCLNCGQYRGRQVLVLKNQGTEEE